MALAGLAVFGMLRTLPNILVITNVYVLMRMHMDMRFIACGPLHATAALTSCWIAGDRWRLTSCLRGASMREHASWPARSAGQVRSAALFQNGHCKNSVRVCTKNRTAMHADANWLQCKAPAIAQVTAML